MRPSAAAQLGLGPSERLVANAIAKPAQAANRKRSSRSHARHDPIPSRVSHKPGAPDSVCHVQPNALPAA
jgi:hypothetical protein